ncbi:MAG: hypothetical protein V3576_06360 [Candidatus Cloacimonadota bacterium]
MSKKLIFLLAVLGTLLLTGCESGSHIHIVNRSNHPLTYKLKRDHNWITIGANSELTFSVDTATQSFLSGDVTEEVSLFMQGETYQIYNYNTLGYTDSTRVTVQAGKTYNIYIDPNRASVKIINNSPRNITKVDIFKHNGVTPMRLTTLENIAPGESRNYHVNHSMPVDAGAEIWIPTPATNFYYFAVLTDDEDNEYTYGSQDTVLYKDQQFLINYTDVEK